MSGIATAIIGAGVITGGAAIYSSNKASKAANQATQAQVESADEATQANLEMYYQSREDLAPWIEKGEWALGEAKDIIQNVPTEQDFAESPSYNFLFDEGMRAVTRAASAGGRLDSGRTIREATRFGQGLASTGYSNYLTDWLRTKLNPVLSLSGSGQVAAGESATAALNTGSNIAQNYLLAGNARASGYINQANAYTGGITGATSAINQGLNNYLFYDLLK